MELNNNNSFGIGEGELIEIVYELPLPMRLDRWLVSKGLNKVEQEFNIL